MAESPTRPSPEALLTHVEWVRRLARLLVADVNDAADVEQETWRQALERPPSSMGRAAQSSQLRRWLTAVTRNVARKLVRSQETRERHEGKVAESAASGFSPKAAAAAASEVTARAELHRRVVDRVLALDELYRAPLLLRFFDDLSAQEVARRLGVPVETARTRIKRGLALVRAQLGGELGVDGADFVAALAPLLLPRGAGMSVGTATATTGAKGAASASAGAAAGVAGVAGLVLGGVLVSKFMKVGAAVVVAGAALFGTYRLWIAPRLPDHAVVDAAKAAADLPAPASVPNDAPPKPAVVESTREAIDGAKGESATVVVAHGTIEGTVLDPAGRPVAGATVVVDRMSTSPFWNHMNYPRLLRQFARKDERAHTWLMTTSANDGSFRFDEIDAKDRLAIAAMLDLVGMGWNETIAFTGDPPRARVAITLQAGVVLFGSVTDSLGMPVAVASVTMHGMTAAPEKDDYGWGGEFEDFVNSAEDGSYRSLPLPWRHVKVHVYVHGREDLAQVDLPWAELPAGVREVRRDLVVPALTTLRGRILGPDGMPARLATTLVPKLGEDAQRAQTRQTIAAVAFAEDPRLRPELVERLGTNQPGLVFLDSDHTYGSLSLAEDRYEIPLRSATLRFVAIVARDQLLGVAEFPQPPVPTDVTIDLNLLPARSLMHGLRLHFRDGRDGSPLSGVSFHAQTISRTKDGQLGMSILNFLDEPKLPPDRVLELPRTPLTIDLRCDGFVSRTCSIDASRADAPRELTIDFLPASGTIAVHLEDEGGQPIAGASLRIYHVVPSRGAPATGDDLQPVVHMGEPPTDEHGDCTLKDLPAGECLIVAQKEGYASTATRVTIEVGEAGDAAAGPVPADLVMERGYEVTLQARLPDGTPAPGGQFALLTEDGVPLYDQFHPQGGAGRLAGKKVRVIDGTYVVRCRVPALAEGTTKFVAAPGASVTIDLAATRND